MKIFVLLCLLFFSILGWSQNGLPKYWITFTDKENTPYSIETPQEFLSSRAINRRERQDIGIDESDLPVNPDYLERIGNKGIRIINISRWFNGALIELDDTTYLDTLRSMTFILPAIIKVKPGNNEFPEKQENKFKSDLSPVSSFYGYSYNQIRMLSGQVLHEQGFTGEGMLIAQLDAGYTNANTISSLQHIWDENRVIVTRDFVKDGLDFFSTHAHGTIVLSALAGYAPDILIGTAPDASFALIRTEDDSSEYLIEEYNWISGAEFADSLGADVINASLGYTQFDDPSQNHTFDDFDGKTTPVAKAATMASKKGMIVVVSAGNNGDDPWFRIGSPADGDGILAVGATDSLGKIAFFSSRGPSADGRVKPDVSAQGLLTVSQSFDNRFVLSSGTSISSPLIAGMAACLWQANPDATSMEIIEKIKQSGNRYFESDSVYGYGIPDFARSDRMLLSGEEQEYIKTNPVSVFPNPSHEKTYLRVYREGNTGNADATIKIFDLSGRLNYELTLPLAGELFVTEIPTGSLATGLYYLKVDLSGNTYSLLFSKN